MLRAEKVPYQVIGGMRFFERAEVKDLLSYLRLVDNPKSDVDLVRIINVPPRKIGATTLERLVDTADERGLSLYDALSPLCEGSDVGFTAKKALLAFRDLINHLRLAAARDAAAV